MAATRNDGKDLRIYSFQSKKGGVGKTTLALAAALRFARAGERVVVLDLDHLAPAWAWIGVFAGLTTHPNTKYPLQSFFLRDEDRFPFDSSPEVDLGKVLHRVDFGECPDSAGDKGPTEFQFLPVNSDIHKMARYNSLTQGQWEDRFSELMRWLYKRVRPTVVLFDCSVGLMHTADSVLRYVLKLAVEEAQAAGYGKVRPKVVLVSAHSYYDFLEVMYEAELVVSYYNNVDHPVPVTWAWVINRVHPSELPLPEWLPQRLAQKARFGTDPIMGKMVGWYDRLFFRMKEIMPHLGIPYSLDLAFLFTPSPFVEQEDQTEQGDEEVQKARDKVQKARDGHKSEVVQLQMSGGKSRGDAGAERDEPGDKTPQDPRTLFQEALDELLRLPEEGK